MSIIGLIIGVLIGALFSGLIIWLVGKLNLGLEVDGFGPAYVVAIVIGVINLIILWLLNALNISIAGGLLGAVINLVIAAAVLMLGSNIVSGVRTKGFVGALVAALAIAVVGWLIVLALGAVVPA
ncbi:MAG: phage holin family protein [Caldilineaceae bacterium]|nr:phage holin family protein [Caldilineaceae bacterium]